MIELATHLPSSVQEMVTKPNSQLFALIMASYDLTEAAKADPVKLAGLSEYNYPDECARVILAREGDRIVGSLTVVKWQEDPENRWGSRFWPKLRELDPDLEARVRQSNPMVCSVAGAVTDSTRRNEGIGVKLYQEVLRSMNPTILVGQTKTPAVIALRRNIPGYRCFYGEAEVTPGHEQLKTLDHRGVLDAYLDARQISTQELLPEGMLWVSQTKIAPTVPNASNMPSIVSAAFNPLIQAQRRLAGEGKTVMSSAINIRQEILK